MDDIEKIIEIICEQASLEVGEVDINSETNFKEELDIDSLDAVEIIMAIEDEFNVEIADEVAEKLSTVGELVDSILSQI